MTSFPARPASAAAGSIATVGNGGNDTYAVLPSVCRIRLTGSSRPSSARNTGRVISRRPDSWLPSSSTTVSTLAQSSPTSGGSIAARARSQASAW